MSDPKQARWDNHFMEMAKLVAKLSKDRSHGVGCVITTPDHIVLSTGYNGFPRGVADGADDIELAGASLLNNPGLYQAEQDLKASVEARHNRPAKYQWTEHAERNAIYNVARTGGRSLYGCRIYVPWFPCVDCTRAIIQSGISEVVACKPDFNDPRWGEQFRVAVEMLQEAGVSVRYVQQIEPSKQ